MALSPVNKSFPGDSPPSVASTPYHPIKFIPENPDSPDSRLKNDATFTPMADTKKCASRFQSLRHSLGHISVRTQTSKRPVWTSQRTSRLFDLLTRPALLFTPSLGIRLPFGSTDIETSGIGCPSGSNRRLSLRKRNLPIDPDPCLLSVDGLLDCLFAVSNLVDQVCYDCQENMENLQPRDEDPYDRSPTMLAAEYFRKRVTPALARLSDLRIKLSDFHLGKFIGRGACGVVRVVHEVAPPGSVYAMKSQFKGAWLHHDPEGAQLMLERTVLAQAAAIENPWLPHLHYAFQDDKNLHLVMDYEPGGDLYIFLSKVDHLLDAEMIAFYAAEAVEAVHSLHRMGYIHCDLKPENFAIERSGHLKLLDFGSAIRLDADGKCICPTMVGTKEYLNIELLRQRGRRNEDPFLVGPEYDYWAIGVLLYELFYSRTPFYEEDEDRMMQKIVDYKKTLKFPSNANISEDAIHLIRSLITMPAKRLTYDGVIRHPFFKQVDFATLRQTTPPYLPPVGELDDVSNFSGGGARTRDETIMDVSTNQTFSPVRMAESCPRILHRSVVGSDSNLPSSSNTQLDVPKSPPIPDAPLDKENLDPVKESVLTTEQPLLIPPISEREKKEQAIREAAAVSVREEIDEIEDIEWEGSDCVRNLPFVGYTFTPGLVLLRKLTSGQAAAVAAAGLGTTMVNHPETFNLTASPSHKSSRALAKPNSHPFSATVIDGQQSIPVEFLDELTKIKRLFGTLESRIKLFGPSHAEQAKLVQLHLAAAIEDTSNLVVSSEAIHTLLNSVAACEKYTYDQLLGQSDRLLAENRQLQALANESTHYRATVDKIRITLSRLDALPNDFVEADLLELLRTICPVQDGLESSSLIHQIVNLLQRQLKQASSRESAHRLALASVNRELKDAWEASKQHIGTLDSMIADQRQLRECENRLNREIQELNGKLADAKQYQRDLRTRCVVYEDKYFAACDALKEEKLLNERLQSELEGSKSLIKLRETDRDTAVQRETVLKGQLVEYERALNDSRHESSMLRDRCERLKMVTADLEESLRNREGRAASSLHRELTDSREELGRCKVEIMQLKAQFERLRVNNTQLLNQRDDANQQVRELTAALAHERELGEVTQQASENEIFRLTTITKQQGKLIDHMCGLLPPEHRPLRALGNDRFDLTNVPSQINPKRSTVKLLGHRAFKTGARRTCKTGNGENDPPAQGGGGPLIAAASAFFSRRRIRPVKSEHHLSSAQNLPDPHTFVKQPSRLKRIVHKSGLRFKRRTFISPRPIGCVATESDQIFTEDDDDLADTLPYYSSDSANDFDEFDCGLPMPIPTVQPEIRSSDPTCDPLMGEDSISSGPSTTSSAPSGPVGTVNLKSSWRRIRSKAHVGWAEVNPGKQCSTTTPLAKYRSQPKLLKQLSKVLSKSKPLSNQTENTGR